MNIAICIGGTGVRCFEAFLYSIAAGQIAEDIEKKITVLIIDKDKNCKTVSDCKAAISAYKSMRDTLREGGVDTSFAEIQVEEYTDWDLDEIIKTMVPPGNDVTLKNAVGPSSDNKLLDAMFSDKEQNVPLDQGFYGHPAIGSILFNRVIADHPLGLVEEVRRELSGVGSSSKIFIFGSVFGGTGAAILPHIARLFKDIDNRVVVGGVMMLPYFKVPSSINSQYLDVIDDNTFLQKTLTALEHYNGPGYKIVKNAPSDSGYCFDTLYVIGMAPRASTTVKYAEGGSDQYSHKHFVDMFAAIAACDFFSRKTNNEKEGVYALRIFSQDDVRDDIDWSCIPNIGDSSDLRIKLIQLLRTFFNKLEGFHVQFNVVSRETLIDAQINPEKHRDLIVRVAGYSAFFNVLSKQTQDDIIARTEQILE